MANENKARAGAGSGKTRSTYRRVSDILELARSFHGRIAAVYEKTPGEREDPRWRLLLDHLQEHEELITQALDRYDDVAPEDVRETWLQYVAEGRVREELEHQELEDDADLETALEAVLAFDRALVGLYDQLAEASGIRRVRELFQDLRDLEETKQRSFSMALQPGESYQPRGPEQSSGEET